MLVPLEKIKEEYKRKTFRRVLTNRMTIVAYRLFKYQPDLHLAFICYRLKIDFGFTFAEICNFTGIPPHTLKSYIHTVARILKSEVLKSLSDEGMEQAIDEWERTKIDEDSTIAYYRDKVGDDDSWFSRMISDRNIKWKDLEYLGSESENFFNNLMTLEKNGRQDTTDTNTKTA